MTSEVILFNRNAGTGQPQTAAAGVSVGGDLRELLQRFLDPLVRLAGARGGAVRVISDSSDRLKLVSSMGGSANLCHSGREMDRHCGFCGHSADGLRLVWATDLSTCATSIDGEAPTPLSGMHMLTLPLRHRQRVLGVCNLFFAAGTEPAPQVMAVLESAGELVGLALDHARLEAENLQSRLADERQVMAAEVHDSLAQSLTFVKMRMPLLRDALVARDDLRTLRYFEDVRDTVDQAHSCLRSVLTHFRAPPNPEGLAQALEAGAQNFRRVSGAKLEFDNGLPEMKLAPEHEAQVFHIVQEALTNIARHAAASHATLRLSQSRPGEVEVVIEDDGIGLPAMPPGGTHYGMEIMHERARRLGGTLESGPRDGGGTRIRLNFPLNESAAAPAADPN